MKKIHKLRTVLCMVVVSVFLSLTTSHAGVDTSGADFLKITPGARNGAMGESTSAMVTGVESINIHPAGFSSLKVLEVFAEHAEWFESIRYEALAAAVPVSFFVPGSRLPGVVALGAQVLYVTPFSIYDYWGREYRAKATFAGLRVNAGYAMEVYRIDRLSISAGGVLGLVHKKGGGTGMTKPSLDAGALAKYYLNYPAIEKYLGKWITGSLVIQNIDVINSGVNENLPLGFKAGFGMKVMELVNFNVDFPLYFDSTPFRAAIGAEYWFRDMVAIRLGTKLGYEQLSHFTSGIGVKYSIGKNMFHLDYALIPYAEDFGITSRFSFSTELGSVQYFGDSADVLYYKGNICFIQSDYNKAIQYWKQTLKVDPNYTKAKLRIEEGRKILQDIEKNKATEAEMQKLLEPETKEIEKKTE